MRKRRFGDRYDGYRIRNCDPTNTIIPFLLKERCDSLVYFDKEIDLTKLKDLIKQKRDEGLDIGLFDYILTAVVRTMSQYPRINRFVAGRRLYARNGIYITLVIKKELNVDTHRTLVKIKLDPKSTVNDINAIIRDVIYQNKGKDAENELDRFIKKLNHLPRPLYSLTINFLSWLDFHGIMPKYINKICPFHSSAIITNMGSIGADPIYHHICNWGTTSIFIANGTKKILKTIDKDGNVKEKYIAQLRFAADERIADGFYLSKSTKYFSDLFLKPELLEIPPEKVIEDEQI